jgi:hypothetical protein
MADMATLTALRDKLEAARASGVLTVESDGDRVTYKSDADMAAALASLNAQIAQLAGTRVTEILFETSKGN